MDMKKFNLVKERGSFKQLGNEQANPMDILEKYVTDTVNQKYEEEANKNILIKLLYQIFRLLKNIVITIVTIVLVIIGFLFNIAWYLITCFIALFIFGYVLGLLGIL